MLSAFGLRAPVQISKISFTTVDSYERRNQQNESISHVHLLTADITGLSLSIRKKENVLVLFRANISLLHFGKSLFG